jgi:hypothetical protein
LRRLQPGGGIPMSYPGVFSRLLSGRQGSSVNRLVEMAS